MDRQRGRGRHHLTVSGRVAVASPPGRPGDGAAAPRNPAAAGRWLWAAGRAAAGVALFVAYLRLTNTYPEDSDQANLGLQAWDMLHGNLLLHGWVLSDVSFYTTELPQYMLLELIGGLNTGTFHAAAAMTYTLAVLLAAMLAKGGCGGSKQGGCGGSKQGGCGGSKQGRASGRRGAARALIAGGIMLAPQLGSGVFILLLTVGHIGTSVPLLVTWLVLDRGRPRWQLAVIIGVLLTWGAIADSLVLAVGAVPVALVCAMRVLQGVFSDPTSPTSPTYPASLDDPTSPAGLSGPDGRVGRALGTRRFEVYLGAAAVASAVVSQAAVRLIHALGGYTLHAVTFTVEPASTWPSQVASTWRGLLVLFGAGYTGLAGHDRDVALLHLVGLALAAAGLILAGWRFFGTATIVDQVLAAAIAVNLVLYVVSNMPSLNAHEMAIVLPCAAALAGRMLVRPDAPAPAPGRRGTATTAARAVAATAGAGVLAGYLGGLAREARHPAVPAQNLPLAAWLAAHHLTYGLGGYWLSSVITVETGGQVRVRALMQFTMQRDLWESKYAWYQPRGQYANFVVFENLPGFYYHWEPRALVHRYFGDPARSYHVGPWTVLEWNRNLLPDIPGNPS